MIVNINKYYDPIGFTIISTVDWCFKFKGLPTPSTPLTPKIPQNPKRVAGT
jgi:hypothetical protein